MPLVLIAATLGVSLAVTPLKPPDTKVQTCYVVADANNNAVGSLISFATGETLLNVNGRLVSIQTATDFNGFAGLWRTQYQNSVYFTSPDCSGAPIVGFDPESFSSPSAMAGARMTVYVAQAGAAPGDFVAGSVINTLSDTCYPVPPSGLSGAPGEALINLADLFTPPFHAAAIHCQ